MYAYILDFQSNTRPKRKIARHTARRGQIAQRDWNNLNQK